MRFTLSIWLCTLSVLTTAAAGAEVVATGLKCEYLVNPRGIAVARPRLSWIVPCDRRGQRQTAYRILVAGTPDELSREAGSLWDSGKMDSGQSTLIEYAGQPLGARMRCHWKVKVWDKDGREAAWSQPARWSISLLRPDDWQAQWIADGKASGANQTPSSLWLRKTFILDGQPEHAEAYVATLGYHELFLRREGHAAVYQIDSGQYEFQAPWPSGK